MKQRLLYSHSTLCIFLLLILLSGINSSSSSGFFDIYNVHLELSKESVTPGENLEAACTVTSTHLPVLSPNTTLQVIWFKILPESSDPEVEIATNYYINSDFNATRRYQVGLSLVGNDPMKVIFVMNIFKVRVGDSGYLGCRVGGSNVESFKVFTVVVPVVNVSWSSYHTDPTQVPSIYSNREKLSFNEAENANLACVVTGSYPRPHVKVYVGSEEISKFFSKSVTLVREEGTRGLQEMFYRVLLFNKSLVMHYRYKDKELTCQASVQPISFWDHHLTASVFISISQYRPKFFCTQRLKVNKSSKQMVVSCLIKALPNLNYLTFNKTKSSKRLNRLTPSNSTSSDPLQHFSSQPSNPLPPPLLPSFSTTSSKLNHSSLPARTSSLPSNQPPHNSLPTSVKETITHTDRDATVVINDNSKNIYDVINNNENNNDNNNEANSMRGSHENNNRNNNNIFANNNINNNNKNNNDNDMNEENRNLLNDDNGSSASNNSLSFAVDHFFPRIQTKKLNNDKTLVTVTLQWVASEHAGTYEFHASNEAGSQKHLIHLFDPVEPSESKSQSSRSACWHSTGREVLMFIFSVLFSSTTFFYC